jgi:hypothetical protein
MGRPKVELTLSEAEQSQLASMARLRSAVQCNGGEGHQDARRYVDRAGGGGHRAGEHRGRLDGRSGAAKRSVGRAGRRGRAVARWAGGTPAPDGGGIQSRQRIRFAGMDLTAALIPVGK